MTLDTSRLSEVIDQVFSSASLLLNEELGNLEIVGSHRRFLVQRMGFTGSGWLAKLLNSHPEVFCSHERVISRVFPRNSFDSSDIVQVIRQLAADTTHGAYRAAGDVGSAWTLHLLAVHGTFTTGLLMRHPARVLNTLLQNFDPNHPFNDIPEGGKLLIRELWDIDVDRLTPIDAMFLHNLQSFANQVYSLGKIDVLMRLEDLQNAEYCLNAVQCLTGVEYDRSLVERAVGKRVHQRTAREVSVATIVRQFNPWQREWYLRMLRDTAPLLGYDPEGADDAPAPAIPEDSRVTSCSR